MFATIRKHQQWLFYLICAVVIVSFVIFFSPDVGFGRGAGGPVSYGVIKGKPVTRAEFYDAQEEESIEFFSSFGDWPSSSRVPDQLRTNFTRSVLERLVVINKLEELGIEVGEDAVVARIRLLFRGENGAYDPAAYDGFVTNALRRAGMDDKDLFRFVRRQAAIEQLRDAVAVTGQLVTRAAAEADFRAENERLATEAVFFNISNFLAKVEVDTNAVRAFFTNRSSMYRVPAKRQVSYVRFDASNYLAEAEAKLTETVTNLNAQLDRIYLERGANTFTDDEGKPLSAEAAKEEIRRDELQRLGLRHARIAANDFAQALFAKMESQGSFLVESNFVDVAGAKQLPVKISDPFSQFETPTNLNVSSAFSSAAFRLGGTNIVSLEPIIEEDSVFLIALNKLTPSQAKKFEEVADDVAEDFRQQEALNKMRQETRDFYQKITNSIAGGKEFKAAAEELKLTVVDVKPFARTDRINLDVSRHSISFPMYQGAAFRANVGEVSYPQTTSESGFMLHVKARVGADEAKVKEELDDYINMLRQRRQSAAFQAWISREIQASGMALPVAN